jgi:hypothetical protein
MCNRSATRNSRQDKLKALIRLSLFVVLFLDVQGLGPSAARRNHLISEINSIAQSALCKKVCNSSTTLRGNWHIVRRDECPARGRHADHRIGDVDGGRLGRLFAAVGEVQASGKIIASSSQRRSVHDDEESDLNVPVSVLSSCASDCAVRGP